MSNDSRSNRTQFVLGVIIFYLTFAGNALFFVFVLKISAVASLAFFGGVAFTFMPFVIDGYRLLKVRLGGQEALLEVRKKVECIRLGPILVQSLILLPITFSTSMFAITYFLRFGICVTAVANATIALVAGYIMIFPLEKLFMKFSL